MKIISKQKDYYDGCLGYGIDETVVYVRQLLEVDRDTIAEHPAFKAAASRAVESHIDIGDRRYYQNIESKQTVTRKGKQYTYNINAGFIGFCGKIYPYLCITRGDCTDRKSYKQPKRTFHYEFDDLAKEMKKCGLKFAESGTHYWGSERRFTEKNAKKFFDVTENYDVFFEMGNPVFAVFSNFNYNRHWEVEENPVLSDFQFYKVVDPFTAFQELAMFISGVLGQAHPPMIEIDDKQMAIKKGFGHKYAFRKPPEK